MLADLEVGSGDEGDRTLNLLVANQALSQLSYVPRIRQRPLIVPSEASL